MGESMEKSSKGLSVIVFWSLVLLVSIVLFLVFYFGFIRTKIHSHSSIVKHNKALIDISYKANNYTLISQKLQREKGEKVQFGHIFSKTNSNARLLEIIALKAINNGLSLEKFDSNVDERSSNKHVKDLNIQTLVYGSYQNILKFLMSVFELPVVFSVQKLAISVVDKKSLEPKLQASFSIRVYLKSGKIKVVHGGANA